MATNAVINQNYIDSEDGSQEFDSPIVSLEKPVSSLGYQFKWSGSVSGTFTFYASIFIPYEWENLIACEEVTFKTSDTADDHFIVSLPEIWLNVGFIKFTFVPDGGSTGSVNVAMRVVPT